MTLDRAALPFVAGFGAAAIISALWTAWASVPFVFLTLFSLWFFRDPARHPPARQDVLLSPADGRVIRVESGSISIFLNVFDVHVCRTPSAGRVKSVDHVPGRFLAAFKDEASEVNERAVLVVKSPLGSEVRFVLVAGLVARRIVCRVRIGDTLEAGDRIGLIRFGSRVDVDVPGDYSPRVVPGQRVRAGETILAERASMEPASPPPNPHPV